MLRAHPLVLTALTALAVSMLWSGCVFATTGYLPETGGGGSCTYQVVTDSGDSYSYTSQQVAVNSGLYTCTTGGTYVPEGLIVGSVDQTDTALSCTTSNAGMIEWTGSAFQGCTGSSWTSFGGGSTTLNGILAATSTSSINNGANAITWAWNSLAGNTALALTTTDLTSGTILQVENTGGNNSTGYAGYFENITTGAGYALYALTSGTANAGYAGYFINSTSGAGYGIYGSVTDKANTGYAGYFTNTDTGADANYGVYANSSSTSGIGVYGVGGQYGVEGNNNGSGVGVYGQAATGGIGVEGLNGDPGGYGVYGYANSSSGYGVYGMNSGGYAGYFTNADTSAASYGIYGTSASSSGYGVYGNNSSTGYAGYFNGKVNVNSVLTVSSCVGCATAANSSLSSLTSATTTNSIDSTNNAQTWGWSTLGANAALTLTTSMTTGTLLSLINTNTSNNAGIALNISNSETGASYGIKSSSTTTGAGYGVYGSVTGHSNTGYAGYFTDTSTTGVNYGLYASTSSSFGYGVYGVDNNASGYGGYFANSTTGYALYASGNANITGSAQVGSTTASCASGNAGAVQYTSGTLEACNGTSWIAIDSGMHFTKTLTANNSASLQFTSLPTSYNTLFLDCEGLLDTNATLGSIAFFVGEGATPTWETGSHYTVAYMNENAGGGSPSGSGTTTGADMTGTGGLGPSSTQPTSIKLWIGNVGSSTLYKYYHFELYHYNGYGTVFYYSTGAGYWNNDTNAITGIEVLENSGSGYTISSGTCSLYGMN